MKRKMDGYASPSEQRDAIDAWKAKNGVHAARVKNLNSRIGLQKKHAATEAKKRQWKSDRDSMRREQDHCEDELRSLYSAGLDAGLQEYRVSLETARIQFTVEIDERLRTAQSAVRSNLVTDSTRVANELRQYLCQENASLAAQLSLAEAQEGQGQRRQSHATNLDAVFQEFEERLDALATPSTTDCSDLYDTLSCALGFARENALARAGGPPVAQSTATDDVLATVTLVLKMADRGRNDSLKFGTSASVIERVRSTYPQMTRHEAQLAVDDAIAWRSYVRGCRAAAVDYRKAAQSIIAMFEAAVSANNRVEAMTKDKEAVAVESEHRKAELHSRAEEKRQLYAAKVEAQLEQERAEQEKEAARLAKIKAQRMQELQVRMDCLAVYMQKRRELAEEEARQEVLRKGKEDAEREERQRRNGERVTYRREEYAERQEDKKRQAQEVERLRAEKQAALERFFRAVDERIGVEANPDRLLLSTIASSQATKAVHPSGSVFGVANGYSDEQIMKDPRVKLYAALMEAGLHKTEYGREVATRGFRVSPAQQASETNPLRGAF